MNENNEIISAKPSDETTNTEAIFSNRSKINKKRTKTAIILTICGICLISALLVSFFISTSSASAISNTLDCFAPDHTDAFALFDYYSENGFSGSYYSYLPRPYNLSLNGKFNFSSDYTYADLTSTIRTGKKYTMKVYCTEELIGISGLDETSEDYVYIPLESFKEKLDRSIFHPDSGSRYALSQEEYDLLLSYIDPNDEALEQEKKLKKAEKELAEIFEECLDMIDTKNVYGWSFMDFTFSKTVNIKINASTWEKIQKHLKEEIETNEDIQILFDEKIGIMTKEEFTQLTDNLTEALSKNKFEMSYTVSGAKLQNIYIENIISTDTGDAPFEIHIDFNYKSPDPTINIKTVETYKDIPLHASSLYNGDQINTCEGTLTLKKNSTDTEYDLVINESTEIIYSENKKQIVGGEPIYVNIVFNKQSGEFTATGGNSIGKNELLIHGIFIADKEDDTLIFSIDRYTFSNVDIEEKFFKFELLPPEKAPENTEINGVSLFDMTEKEFTKFTNEASLKPIEVIIMTLSKA